MDRELGGSRYGHYGGGGGGRHNRHHGGRGRGRGRGGGRGGYNRHQPYNNNRSRGGPPRGGGRGNRFGGAQSYTDPQTLMVRQVYSFVSRVGEFKNIRVEESSTPEMMMRPVVSTTAANINDLTAVLCAQDKCEMLLKFSTSGESMDKKPEEKVGKLVHLVISCAAALPLQTPCYAALTLAVHEQVKGGPWEGFASRCVEYAMLNMARDLDTVLLVGKEQARATCRIKLMLRYLVILGRMGIVKPYEEGEESSSAEPSRMTVFGLLSLLVEAATAAMEQHNNPTAAYILSTLVLTALPYIMVTLTVPRDVVDAKLLKPIEESILASYKSNFAPGVGISSILLQGEQLEEDGGDEEEEEDEDEGEDEDDDASGQICDSLQDLLRASQRLRNQGEATRFCLPVDAPWKGLMRLSTPNPEGGESESYPITFSEEALFLSFSPESEAITLLLGGDSPLKLQCFNLEGIVFGRLPIFGSPADPDDDDEDEEEMEGATKNEQLEAFTKGFSILDRYFVAETMRDCLICHESNLNPTGVQQGGAKTAAEELLSVCHVFSGDNSSVGLEYAILETLMALIAQSNEHSSLRQIFLSRVLLELTKLEPSRLSPALAVAMNNLFQDYLPALCPVTRDNFSSWFAFHLINTDYQWPSAYWKLWEPFATSMKPTSRGSFVRRALNLMAENVSDPAVISSQCLSETKSLNNELFGRTDAEPVPAASDGPEATLESEIHRRIWDNDEDPTLLNDYLVGEEVSTALAGMPGGGRWSRTDVLIRVIVDPARQMYEGLKRSLEEKSDSDDQMTDNDTLSKDVHVIITDCIARYAKPLLAAIAKDADISGGDKDEMVIVGGAFLLRRVESVASYSPSLLEALVSCMVKHRVVSSLSVLRWVLGDLGDSFSGSVVSRWWTFAVDALQENSCSLESDATGGGSMAVDGGGMDSDEEFSSQATKLVNQMLHYAVPRVCSLLVSAQSDEKRLNPLQVDLIEGMKSFALKSKLLLVSGLTSTVGMRKALTVYEAHQMLTKAEITGSMLSELCVGQESSTAVNLLQRSLKKI